MLRSVTQYRVMVLGRPRGPWRSDRAQARRDAIEIEVGEYDADGRFWLSVPGEIEVRVVTVELSHAA